MTLLDETTAKRIGKLVRMLSSSYENERHVALHKLGSLLNEEGLSFNDLGTVIENANGEIEALKYSDADMAEVARQMKERGLQEGYQKAKAEKSLPPEFYDSEGSPRWYEIAKYTKEHLTTRLKPGFEEDFVGDAPIKMLSYGRPRTAKQARWILAFFIRAGGKVPSGLEFDGELIS